MLNSVLFFISLCKLMLSFSIVSRQVEEESIYVSYLFSFRICKDALQYFVSLESSSHRDAWTSLLLLLLNRLLKLDDNRVRYSRTFLFIQNP